MRLRNRFWNILLILFSRIVRRNPLRFESFSRLNLKINYLDIGGADGASNNLIHMSKLINLTCVEPDERASERTVQRLKEQGFNNIFFITDPLSSEPSEKQLFLTKKQQCSSLFRPNTELVQQFPCSDRFDVEREVSFYCKRLDDVDELTANKPDWVKIDVQGGELDILRGGSRLLRKSLVIEIEIEFAELYSKQPLFRDVDNYLKEQEFQIVDLELVKWKPDGGKGKNDLEIDLGIWGKNQLIFGNAIYIRKDLLPQCVEASDVTREDILKTIIALCSYRQFSLAINILKVGQHRGIVSDRDYEIVIETLRDSTINTVAGKMINLFGVCKRIRANQYYFDMEY